MNSKNENLEISNMSEIIIVLGNSTKSVMEKRVDRALEEFNRTPCEVDYDGVSIICKTLLFSGGSGGTKRRARAETGGPCGDHGHRQRGL